MRRYALMLTALLLTSSIHAQTTSMILGPYQYDGAGNIRSIGTEQFLYDRDGRLMSGAIAPGTQTFDYDTFGNRNAVTTSGVVTCNGGADCARLATVNGRTNHIAGASYDAAGNVWKYDGRTYTYDPAGVLTSQYNVHLIQYVYTAGDERVAIYDGARWQWSVRDADSLPVRVVSSDDGPSGAASANWTWIEDSVFRGQLLLAAERNGATRRHFHLDHLGTPRLVTDDSGAVIGSHEYYPYGTEPDNALRERPEESMKFTGHERDLAPGDVHVLDYMHARYYDGATGRFLSLDVAVPNPSKPQTWNRYAYTLNQPVNFLDANGQYRTDFHHDLTQILAVAAGFSEAEAAAIAAQTEAPDHDGRAPMSRNPLTLFNYPGRRNNHFVTAQRLHDLRINALASLSSYDIGTYLHAAQDSFSHAGFGPLTGHLGYAFAGFAEGLNMVTPPYPPANVAEAANGFQASWDVDTTSARPALAMQAAQSSYKDLVDFNVKGSPKAAWGAISGLVNGYLSSDEHSAARNFYKQQLCKQLGMSQCP